MLADVYLAHNGSVYKEEIARSLGLEDLAEAYTDSHLVLKKIAKDLQGSPPDELADRLASSLSGILPYVKSALEILVMITAPGLEPFPSSLRLRSRPARQGEVGVLQAHSRGWRRLHRIHFKHDMGPSPGGRGDIQGLQGDTRGNRRVKTWRRGLPPAERVMISRVLWKVGFSGLT